jgi:GNAT superfamily N-acetyltransferase
MSVHLAVESILAGKTASRMLVDDAEAPRAAVTWSGHRLYLVGDVGGGGFGEELNRYASTHGQFVAYCSPEAIDDTEKLLSGYRVRRRGRLYYEGDPPRAYEVEPPKGYAVERITTELLGRGLAHTDWVREEMCSERESVEEFLGKGFGFAAVHGGGFACWCMSEYNLGDRCEVGIETVKEHRRRGLAVLVAGEVFRHAASVGVRRVGWHCWADNAASVATAERLGLRRVAGYTVLAVDARPTL